jgi:DNA mismatch repair protein MutS2
VEERILRTLEFTKVIDKLINHASCSLGREKITQLRPSADVEQAKQWQQLTFEAYTVLRIKGTAPFGGIRDTRKPVHRAKLGGVLNTRELLDIGSTVRGGWRLRKFIELFHEEHTIQLLLELIQHIERLQEVEDEIESCIDEHGEVADHASPALSQVRSQIRTGESRVKEKLESIIRSSSYQKMLQESIVTVRGDRYVIPVKQEYRHVFGGIVHDQSASGATLFIEPEAVVQLNNHLRELKLKEAREIERILQQLSATVAVYSDSLKENVGILAELDFTFAKGAYAHQIKATQPILNNRGYVRIKKARHPLIPLNDVIPIDVELGQSFTSLVITGPNTGGKTVTLKTIGLHALMAASGIHIPAEDDSEVAVFSGVYVDIGDEQSIEQNLSTFSGHLTNIIQILQRIDENSLVLLDELGAGTDPTEGAALAMAILDYMYAKKAKVVATTHYSELKAFAYNREKVLNASVEFDVETLRPTYRLLIGVPGRSNAFAIANRLGLPQKIIEEAKSHVSLDDTKVENLIASLEQNRLVAEQERVKAEKVRKETEALRQHLVKEQEDFAKEKNLRLQKAEQDAAQSVAKARKEAEEIIADLRKLAQEEHAGIKEHKLIEAKKRLEDSLPSFEREREHGKKAAAGKEPIKVGDEVKVISLGQKGDVIADLGNREYQVQIGIMKMTLKAENLQVVGQQKKKEQVPFTRVRLAKQMIRPEIDLRGYNIEDALTAIDKYLDDAVMANLHQVSLIHGKGTGVLRVGVHNYLKKHRSVNTYRLGGQGEGGLGATIVELK